MTNEEIKRAKKLLVKDTQVNKGKITAYLSCGSQITFENIDQIKRWQTTGRK